MRKSKQIIGIFSVAMALSFHLHAQERKQDASKSAEESAQRNYYSRSLGVDSAKAAQLLKIQTDYKSAMRQLDMDTALNDIGRRAKIDQMIGEKNRKLKVLLSPAQQRKMIPTSELIISSAKQK